MKLRVAGGIAVLCGVAVLGVSEAASKRSDGPSELMSKLLGDQDKARAAFDAIQVKEIAMTGEPPRIAYDLAEEAGMPVPEDVKKASEHHPLLRFIGDNSMRYVEEKTAVCPSMATAPSKSRLETDGILQLYEYSVGGSKRRSLTMAGWPVIASEIDGERSQVREVRLRAGADAWSSVIEERSTSGSSISTENRCSMKAGAASGEVIVECVEKQHIRVSRNTEGTNYRIRPAVRYRRHGEYLPDAVLRHEEQTEIEGRLEKAGDVMTARTISKLCEATSVITRTR